MAKLTDDTLRFNLDINGDPARAEMTRLSNDTAKLKQTNKDLNVELQKMAANGKKNTEEYRNLKKQMDANRASMDANDKKVTDLRKNMKLEQLTLKELRSDYARLKAMRDSATPNSANWKKANNEMLAYKKRMNEVEGSTKSANSVFGMLKGILPVMGFAALAGTIKNVISKAIEVRTTFSRYEAVLKNTLGSQKAANTAFADLQKFAATTPFQLDELTGSYVKLVNQGFKPTMDEMTDLGNIAASQGKSFDQLTEAIIDAQVGENERLKEFGIRAQKNGDKIKYTFKGVTTEVKNNASEIQKYILSLGKLEGVAGSMEAISKTIGGALSNASDATDSLFNAIGKRLEPVVVKLASAYGRFVGGLAKAIEPQKKQIDLYGLENREMNVLFDTLKRGNLTQDARNRLINEINSKYGEYLPKLLTEKSTIDEITKAQKSANDQIRIKIISEAMHDEIIEALKKEKAAVEGLVESELRAAEAKTALLTAGDQAEAAILEQQKRMAELNKGFSEGVINDAKNEENEIKDKYKRIAEYYKIAFSEIMKAFEDLNNQENGNANNKNAVLTDSEKKLQEELFKLRKDYGLLKSAELLKHELDQFKANEAAKLATAEDYMRMIQNIRNKYSPINENSDGSVSDLTRMSFVGKKAGNYAALEKIGKGYANGSGFGQSRNDHEKPNINAEKIKATTDNYYNDVENLIAFEEKRQELISQYRTKSMAEMQAEEMEAIEVYHEMGLMSEETYQAAKDDIDKRYTQMKAERAQEYFATLQAGAQQFSEIFSILQQDEFDAIQDKVSKGLITEEQGKKEELKIRKKYADKQFVATAAQIIASTALGVMQAFAQLGPIGGAIMGAIISALGTVQLISANKQRQRVKQLAKGKYNVIGEDDNKLYSNVNYTKRLNTGWQKTPTLVGEQPEWVIDNATSNNIQYRAPWIFDQINAYRVGQKASGSYPTYSAPATTDPQLKALMAQNAMLLAKINETGIKAKAYYGDEEVRNMNQQQAFNNKLLNQTRR